MFRLNFTLSVIAVPIALVGIPNRAYMVWVLVNTKQFVSVTGNRTERDFKAPLLLLAGQSSTVLG